MIPRPTYKTTVAALLMCTFISQLLNTTAGAFASTSAHTLLPFAFAYGNCLFIHLTRESPHSSRSEGHSDYRRIAKRSQSVAA